MTAEQRLRRTGGTPLTIGKGVGERGTLDEQGFLTTPFDDSGRATRTFGHTGGFPMRGKISQQAAVLGLALFVLVAVVLPVSANDWPTYNGDVVGSRHNAGEKALAKENVGRLEEKWRFPSMGADFQIGAIHATPVVVNGYVYFGTVHKATFYKLTPDGRVKWSFPLNEKNDRVSDQLVSGMFNGIFGSALVTEDAMYFATLAGFVYALDRDTGQEKWRVDLRAKTFRNPKATKT